MTDELEENKELEEDFDPAKIQKILSDDIADLDEVETLEGFESDTPVTDDEEDSFSLYSGEEDLSQFSY